MVASACSAHQPTKRTPAPALPTISDERIKLAIHATGDKSLDVESLLNLVHNIVPDAQVYKSICVYIYMLTRVCI